MGTNVQNPPEVDTVMADAGHFNAENDPRPVSQLTVQKLNAHNNTPGSQVNVGTAADTQSPKQTFLGVSDSLNYFSGNHNVRSSFKGVGKPSPLFHQTDATQVRNSGNYASNNENVDDSFKP